MDLSHAVVYCCFATLSHYLRRAPDMYYTTWIRGFASGCKGTFPRRIHALISREGE